MNDKLRSILSKLSLLEGEMAREKGEFTLYAFLKPAGSMNDWELLVSAAWAVWENFDPVAYIVEKIYRECPDDERMLFARVVIIPVDHPDLDDILDDVDVEHGLVNMRSSRYFKQDYERGYVITSKLRALALGEAS